MSIGHKYLICWLHIFHTTKCTSVTIFTPIYLSRQLSALCTTQSTPSSQLSNQMSSRLPSQQPCQFLFSAFCVNFEDLSWQIIFPIRYVFLQLSRVTQQIWQGSWHSRLLPLTMANSGKWMFSPSWPWRLRWRYPPDPPHKGLVVLYPLPIICPSFNQIIQH